MIFMLVRNNFHSEFHSSLLCRWVTNESQNASKKLGKELRIPHCGLQEVEGSKNHLDCGSWHVTLLYCRWKKVIRPNNSLTSWVAEHLVSQVATIRSSQFTQSWKKTDRRSTTSEHLKTDQTIMD